MNKIFVATLVAGAMLLGGCGSSTTQSSPTTLLPNPTTNSSNELSTTTVQDTVAAFYPLVNGGTVDLARGAQAKPLALWFWAPG